MKSAEPYFSKAPSHLRCDLLSVQGASVDPTARPRLQLLSEMPWWPGDDGSWAEERGGKSKETWMGQQRRRETTRLFCIKLLFFAYFFRGFTVAFVFFDDPDKWLCCSIRCLNTICFHPLLILGPKNVNPP